MATNKIDYEKLLDSCFEIEGLLTLMKYRDEQTPEEVESLLRAKVEAFAAEFGISSSNAEDTAIPLMPDPIDREIAESAEEEESADADIPVMDDDTSEPISFMSPTLFDDDPTMRVDRKLAMEGVADLRNAFSLNDKFRFRRELFGNSDAEFLDTINLISAMGSYAEAEEYLYGDRHWNPEGDDVKDFMVIVRDHFTALGKL